MLDELARAGLGTDWGARMLSKESTLYEPLSYNNGASWPFLSGWAALALYKGGRPDAGWQYVDALADLTFLEARGFIPELLSGDRLRSIDAAVPHQLFATTGFASALMRGLVGLEETDRGLRLAPNLPAGWPYLRVRRLWFRGARANVEIRRQAGGLSSGGGRQGPAFARRCPHAPAGKRAAGRALECRVACVAAPSRRGGPGGPGGPADGSGTADGDGARAAGHQADADPPALALGDESQRLRVVDATVTNGEYVARLQGARGAPTRPGSTCPSKWFRSQAPPR